LKLVIRYIFYVSCAASATGLTAAGVLAY